MDRREVSGEFVVKYPNRATLPLQLGSALKVARVAFGADAIPEGN
jgi:hypothetical protein